MQKCVKAKPGGGRLARGGKIQLLLQRAGAVGQQACPASFVQQPTGFGQPIRADGQGQGEPARQVGGKRRTTEDFKSQPRQLPGAETVVASLRRKPGKTQHGGRVKGQ